MDFNFYLHILSHVPSETETNSGWKDKGEWGSKLFLGHEVLKKQWHLPVQYGW